MSGHCFLLCLIMINAIMAVASGNAHTKLPSRFADHQQAPAPAPYKAEPPTIRKLGRHQPKVVKTFGSAPASSPSADHRTAASIEANNGENVSVGGGGQEIHLQKHQHSMDKSVAGGGVILGGLATTFLVAVFCYIRATGRHKSESNNQSSTEITN